MGEIAKEEGITSFKVYMTYGYGLGDSDLMQILTRAKQDGILIASHCENDGIVNYWREKFVKEGHTPGKVSSDQPSGSGRGRGSEPFPVSGRISRRGSGLCGTFIQ